MREGERKKRAIEMNSSAENWYKKNGWVNGAHYVAACRQAAAFSTSFLHACIHRERSTANMLAVRMAYCRRKNFLTDSSYSSLIEIYFGTITNYNSILYFGYSSRAINICKPNHGPHLIHWVIFYPSPVSPARYPSYCWHNFVGHAARPAKLFLNS